MDSVLISRYPQRPSVHRRKLRQAYLRYILIPWLKKHPGVRPIVLDLEEAHLMKAAGVAVYKTLVDYDLANAVQKADEEAWQLAQDWYRKSSDGQIVEMGEDLQSAVYPSLKAVCEERQIILEILASEGPTNCWLENDAPKIETKDCDTKYLPRVGLALESSAGLLAGHWIVSIFNSRIAQNQRPKITPKWLMLADAPNHCGALTALQKTAGDNVAHLIAINKATASACIRNAADFSGPLAWLSLTQRWELVTRTAKLLRLQFGMINQNSDQALRTELKLAIAVFTPQAVLADLLADSFLADKPSAIIYAVGIWPLYRRTFRRATKAGIPTFIVAHGNIAREPAYYANLGADYALVTGQAMADALSELGVEGSRIKIVGSTASAPAWQPAFSASPIRVVVSMQGYGGEMSYFEYANFISAIHKAALADSDIFWIIRLHPQQVQHWPVWYSLFEGMSNTDVVVGGAGNRYQEISALITVFSTMAIETAGLGIPVVTVNLTGSREHVPLAESGMAVLVNKPENLISGLNSALLHRPTNIDYFQEQSGKEAAVAAVEFINTHAK
jgi:hypothetical protein